jgi:PilZ domain-containing protein
MQKFEYRVPRYVVDLPVLLNLRDSSVAGRCKEISKEGMKVALQHPVAPQTSGTVSISYKDISLELRVSVAHAGPDYDGLKFVFESEKDRSAVEHLVSLLSGPSGPTGPVLVR